MRTVKVDVHNLEKKVEELLKRLEALNSHDAKYCRRCSMILDPEEALRVEHQRQNQSSHQ